MSARYGAIAMRRGYSRRAGSYKKRRRHYSSMAGQIRTAGYFGRYNAIGTEKKFFDTVIADYAIQNAGHIHTTGLLGVIASGTGESQRIGRKILLKSIHIHASLRKEDSTVKADSSTVVRIIVGIDTQCNGVGPVVGDVLKLTNPTVLPTNAFNNLSNKGRFIILKDKYFNLTSLCGAGNGTTNDYGRAYKQFNYNRKLNIPINYSSTTGSISEIRDNVPFMIVSCLFDNDAAIHIHTRSRYTDV